VTKRAATSFLNGGSYIEKIGMCGAEIEISDRPNEFFHGRKDYVYVYTLLL